MISLLRIPLEMGVRCYILLATVVVCASLDVARADKIYESATLGTTGVSSGATLNSMNFLGVRFELTNSAVAESIGGHFFEHVVDAGSIFGALVELDSMTDFPDSSDLTTSSDVLGHALLDLDGTSSAEYAANFSGGSISLSPGFYALVFGSGQFGATSPGGGVPRDSETGGMDIGSPSYFKFKASDGVYSESDVVGARFFLDADPVIEAPQVPEPTGLVLSATAIVCLAGFGLFRSRRRFLLRSGTSA